MLIPENSSGSSLPQLGAGHLRAGGGKHGGKHGGNHAGGRYGAPGGGGSLPAIGHMQEQSLQQMSAEVQMLSSQLRAKDANAQQLLGVLEADPRGSHKPAGRTLSPQSQQREFDPATVQAARVTGLQPSELAEAARIGLTPEDLEQLIEDLAAKEFHQLEQCGAQRSLLLFYPHASS